MYTFLTIVVYLLSFIVLYLLLSCFGLLFYMDNGDHYSYLVIIGSQNWFEIYSFLFGWWTSLFPTIEFYNKVKHKIDLS